MQRSSLVLAVVFLVLSAACVDLGATEPVAKATRQIEGLEQWWDAIIEGKLKDAVLVKVWTGRWDQPPRGDSKRQPRTRYGILLSDTDKTFGVLDLETFEKRSFGKLEVPKQPHRRVAFEPVTLAEVKAKVLEPKDGLFPPGIAAAAAISPAPQSLMACLTYRAGQKDEALKLVREIPRQPRPDRPKATLEQLVADDMSDKLMSAGMRKFGNPKTGSICGIDHALTVMKYCEEVATHSNPGFSPWLTRMWSGPRNPLIC